MTDTSTGHGGAAPAGTHRYATRQRQRVLEALSEHGEFITVQDLHHVLRKAGHRVGLSTVYRALNALVEAEAADTFRDAAGVQHYRTRTTVEHQHYLVCRQCGTSVPITSHAIERWANDTAHRCGFAEVAHVIELTGICAGCQNSVTPND